MARREPSWVRGDQQLGRGQPLRMREHLVTVGAIDSPHVADWEADVQVSDAARRCAQAKACSKGLLRQCVVSKDGCGYSCPCAIRRNGTEPEMVRPLDVIGRCVSQLAHGQPEAWHGGKTKRETYAKGKKFNQFQTRVHHMLWQPHLESQRVCGFH